VKQAPSSLVFWDWEPVWLAQVENLAQLEEEKTDQIHTHIYIHTHTQTEEKREKNECDECYQLAFFLSDNNFDILFSTLRRGRAYFFVFLHFGSQNASSGLIQIHQG